MQDIALIKDRYAAMHDGQLEDIAKKEADKLTPEAFRLLKAAFVQRNLDMVLIAAAEEKRATNQAATAEKIKDGRGAGIVKEYWNDALAEMKQGSTYQQIFDGLLDQGVEEELALTITEGLEIEADKRLQQQKKNIATGALSFFIAIGITLLSLRTPVGGYVVVAYGGVIFGGARLAGGLVGVGSYNKILSNCIKQRELLAATSSNTPAAG